MADSSFSPENQMLRALKTKIPSYMTVRLMNDVPGIAGSVFEVRIDGFIHLVGHPGDEYVPHSWASMTSFSDKLINYSDLLRVVEQYPAALNDIDGFYYEYDYDEKGNPIEGSKRKIEFDKWGLVLEGSPRMEDHP